MKNKQIFMFYLPLGICGLSVGVNASSSIEDVYSRATDNYDLLIQAQKDTTALQTAVSGIDANVSNVSDALQKQATATESGTLAHRISGVQTSVNSLQTSIDNQADVTQTGSWAQRLNTLQNCVMNTTEIAEGKTITTRITGLSTDFSNFREMAKDQLTETKKDGTLAKIAYDTQGTLNNQLNPNLEGSLAHTLKTFQESFNTQTTEVSGGTLAERLSKIQGVVDGNNTLLTGAPEKFTQILADIATADGHIAAFREETEKQLTEIGTAGTLAKIAYDTQETLNNQLNPNLEGSLAYTLKTFQESFNTQTTEVNGETLAGWLNKLQGVVDGNNRLLTSVQKEVTGAPGQFKKVLTDIATADGHVAAFRKEMTDQMTKLTGNTLASKLHELQNTSQTLATTDTVNGIRDELMKASLETYSWITDEYDVLIKVHDSVIEAPAKFKQLNDNIDRTYNHVDALYDEVEKQTTDLKNDTLAARLSDLQTKAETLQGTLTNQAEAAEGKTIATRISNFEQMAQEQLTEVGKAGTLAKIAYDTQGTLNNQVNPDVKGSLAETLKTFRSEFATQVKSDVTGTLAQKLDAAQADLNAIKQTQAHTIAVLNQMMVFLGEVHRLIKVTP